MREYVCLSAMKPKPRNTGPSLAAPLVVGQTMCGKEYFPRNRDVVDRYQKEEVTCPECLKGMANSSMAI